MSGGARQNAADTKSVSVNEDETPGTAADIRAMAEQAEAEAEEAEALAAAARARARAIQLRREAELAEAEQRAKQQPTEETPAASPAEDEADATESVTTEAPSEEAGTEEYPEDAEAETSTEAETSAEAETSTEATAARRSRLSRLSGRLRRPKWSTLAAGLAILVTLAALAGSGYMIKDHRDSVRQQRRVAEFEAAAKQGVVTLTSLDFNHAKEGVQHIVENSTGSFKDDFLKMADDFTKVVEQSKVVSQGTVQQAAVELDSMTVDSAVVLVASTSEVTNAAGAKQDPRNYRLIVTVARDGGQLKISKVEFVP